MAHDLNFSKNQYAFASTKIAWHGLGQIVEKAMTAEEAIKLGGLDYEVRKVPNIATYTDDNEEVVRIINPDSYSTIRTDTRDVLGTVGSRYNVVQNIEAFDFFTTFAGEKAAMFETVGAIGKGGIIFISCKIPDVLIVGKNDVVDEYLLLTNDHTGKGKIKAMFTPIRVVCNNTLNQALRRHNYSMSVEIKHTNSAHEKLKEAHQLLGIHKISMESRSTIYNLLANTPVTEKVAINMLSAQILSSKELALVASNNGNYWGIEEISAQKRNNLSKLEHYLHEGVGQKEIEGTAWWTLNALTGFYQNSFEYKDDSSKYMKIIEGDVKTKTSSLMEELVEYAMYQ